ncbi:vascular-related unknown protein 4-like [Silene latifolia]|uniref:vascular-related unknown protein 4-like n=1 Tax=Silene latifolia TaxID=37657 RepID=UPI003D770F4E
MEVSLNSTNYMSRLGSCRNNNHSHSEESGWTWYINDFMDAHFEVRDDSFFAPGYEISSIVSDNLIKKKRTKDTHVDHDLEDTACSPSFSPQGKDIDMKQAEEDIDTNSI